MCAVSSVYYIPEALQGIDAIVMVRLHVFTLHYSVTEDLDLIKPLKFLDFLVPLSKAASEHMQFECSHIQSECVYVGRYSIGTEDRNKGFSRSSADILYKLPVLAYRTKERVLGRLGV